VFCSLDEYMDSFSRLLNRLMEENGIGCKRLEELLQDEGITDISYKRISEYSNAQHTPSFEKARAILSVLGCPISDEELLALLRVNREIIREGSTISGTYNINKELHTSIRIKLRRLIPQQSPEENERFLRDRIYELFGREKGLSDYIQWLIMKDLNECIISKEEIETNEK